MSEQIFLDDMYNVWVDSIYNCRMIGEDLINLLNSGTNCQYQIIE